MRPARIGLALPLLLGLVACKDDAKEVEITQTRVATVQPRKYIPNATSAQRFGRRRPSPRAPATATNLTFTLPSGWTKQPLAPMRLVNLEVPGGGECYVSQVGGKVQPNVNRWYGQIGAALLDDSAFADLPKIKLLDKDATFVELSGTFLGKPEFMLVGVILEHAQGGRPGVLSVKMIGPAEALKGQIDRFKAFCTSLKEAADPHAGHDHGPGGHDAPANPHGGGQTLGPPTSTGLAVTWKAPDGWSEGKKRAMREVTFTIGGIECYVSILGGPAGGAAANARRWLEQMGETDSVDISALPTLDVLGIKAPLVEARGDYTGMEGGTREGQALLGVICELEGATLFVKMIGPASEVDAQKENFKAFCRSLERQDS